MSSQGTTTPLDVRNVHKLSLYELRQELTRRGAWDFADEDITYRNVLAKMVSLLHQEEEEKQRLRHEQATQPPAATGGEGESNRQETLHEK